MRSVFLNTFLFAMFGYFISHGIYGERGVVAYFTLSQDLNKSLTKLEELRISRLSLEHKVNLLKSATLDPDFLDSESRRVLGYAKPNEEVIKIEKNK